MNKNTDVSQNFSRRILIIDTIRGFLIILVVLYHLLYDLDMIWGIHTGLFDKNWFFTFRNCFVGLLILISGISCNLSRSNLKRGVKTLLYGIVITLVTTIFIPDEQIIFGILHFFGCAMIIYHLLKNIIQKIPSIWGLIICLSLYLLTYDLYDIAIWKTNTFLKYLLFIMGFNTGIGSADYYPILPHVFLFLAGAFAGKNIKSRTLPGFFYKNLCIPLTFLGQHTLVIYILHQPLIYGILYIIFNTF